MKPSSKKIILIIAMLCFVFTLSACGSEGAVSEVSYGHTVPSQLNNLESTVILDNGTVLRAREKCVALGSFSGGKFSLTDTFEYETFPAANGWLGCGSRFIEVKSDWEKSSINIYDSLSVGDGKTLLPERTFTFSGILLKAEIYEGTLYAVVFVDKSSEFAATDSRDVTFADGDETVTITNKTLVDGYTDRGFVLISLPITNGSALSDVSSAFLGGVYPMDFRLNEKGFTATFWRTTSKKTETYGKFYIARLSLASFEKQGVIKTDDNFDCFEVDGENTIIAYGYSKTDWRTKESQQIVKVVLLGSTLQKLSEYTTSGFDPRHIEIGADTVMVSNHTDGRALYKSTAAVVLSTKNDKLQKLDTNGITGGQNSYYRYVASENYAVYFSFLQVSAESKDVLVAVAERFSDKIIASRLFHPRIDGTIDKNSIAYDESAETVTFSFIAADAEKENGKFYSLKKDGHRLAGDALETRAVTDKMRVLDALSSRFLGYKQKGGKLYIVYDGYVDVYDAGEKTAEMDFRKTITAHFDSDGGSEVAPIKLEHTDKLPPWEFNAIVPEKDGYEFVKWDWVGGERLYNVKEDVYFKAIWQEVGDDE